MNYWQSTPYRSRTWGSRTASLYRRAVRLQSSKISSSVRSLNIKSAHTSKPPSPYRFLSVKLCRLKRVPCFLHTSVHRKCLCRVYRDLSKKSTQPLWSMVQHGRFTLHRKKSHCCTGLNGTHTTSRLAYKPTVCNHRHTVCLDSVVLMLLLVLMQIARQTSAAYIVHLVSDNCLAKGLWPTGDVVFIEFGLHDTYLLHSLDMTLYFAFSTCTTSDCVHLTSKFPTILPCNTASKLLPLDIF